MLSISYLCGSCPFLFISTSSPDGCPTGSSRSRSGERALLPALPLGQGPAGLQRSPTRWGAREGPRGAGAAAWHRAAGCSRLSLPISCCCRFTGLANKRGRVCFMWRFSCSEQVRSPSSHVAASLLVLGPRRFSREPLNEGEVQFACIVD